LELQTKISSSADLLDIFATVSYEEQCDNVGLIIDSLSLPDDFFDLKSGVAGEMLQKFSNYGVKLAIIGDYANIDSNSLKAFIRECNRGRLIFFVQNEEEALERLSN